MAQLTAEQAFNQLERNADSFKKDSLDSTEKAALKSVKLEDIKAAKETLGKKVFTINGKSKYLSDIVKNFDTQTNEVKYANGSKEKVEDNSDLAAAIQFYLIANGMDIRTNKQIKAGTKVTNGIDGSIGEVTKDKIGELQNKNTPNKPKGPDNGIDKKTEKFSLRELTSKSFKKYVSPHNLSVFQSHGIMDSGYSLTPTNMSSYINERSLKFEYKYKGKTMKISVPIHEDSNGEVDPQELVNDLVNACVLKEGNRNIEVDNKTAEGGIDNFDESKITDPMVRARTKLDNEKINFVATANNSTGKITIEDKSGKIIKREENQNGRVTKEYNSFTISNTEVLTNGQFDVAKFNNILKKECYKQALAKVKSDFGNTRDNINGMSVSKSSEAQKVVSKYGDLLADIDAVNASGDLKTLRDDVAGKKSSVENKKYCYDELEKMDEDIKTLNKLNGVLTSDNKTTVVNTIKKYFTLKKIGTGKYDYRYTIEDKSTYSAKFTKAGMSNKYNAKKTTMVNIADKYEIEIN